MGGVKLERFVQFMFTYSHYLSGKDGTGDQWGVATFSLTRNFTCELSGRLGEEGGL